MAKKYIIQHRRGTTEQWAAAGDTLKPLEGELVIEICADGKHRLKIGDGQHTYEQLSYLGIDGQIISQPLTRTVTITLIGGLAAENASGEGWQQDADLRYYQTVAIANITANSKVDLQPNSEQLTIFHEKDLAFVTETETINGITTVKVYAIGVYPQSSYQMQATVTEVELNE